MAKLVHPDGELTLSQGAANENIIQCISSNASYTLKSIVSAALPTQPFFFQLYINSERHNTIEILRFARALGIKAVFVTLDAPVPGKREAGERAAQAGTIRAAISGAESSKDKEGSGLGRLMAQDIDKSVTWEDLSCIREASGVPIVLKGVQTADDVRLAVEYGVDGTHSSQASILVLLELREQCPEDFDNLEVCIDGGFERGSDILKAIALGATAVGVGRPFLYSLVYGQSGVEHLSRT
ncbi:Cytochrome b2 [Colletotrichum shisoi]|uniref:Cytochrome b2 n=1 Tax=Colletotrichum shisoi TaxID=2078593 RepID=A0A5Q4BIC8_9PEZI|nr:Cytochrome b2 [Colletotrichum shisoi]